MSNYLNVGCGSIVAEGFYNCDRDDFGQQYIADILEGLPFDDNFFDATVSHHQMQQVPYHDVVPALTELLRVLKPGGVLRISIPDILGGFRAFSYGNLEWFPNGEDNIDDCFCAWLSWYSTNCTPLTYASLASKLIQAGFSSVYQSAYNRTLQEDHTILSLDSREPESIFVEAIKWT